MLFHLYTKETFCQVQFLSLELLTFIWCSEQFGVDRLKTLSKVVLYSQAFFYVG
jgi:hypothetical protein